MRLPSSSSSFRRNSSEPNCCGLCDCELIASEIRRGEANTGYGDSNVDAAIKEPAIKNSRLCLRMSHRCLAMIADVAKNGGQGLNGTAITVPARQNRKLHAPLMQLSRTRRGFV